MNWKPNYAAAVILLGVQFAELDISLTIIIVQESKLIEGLSDSDGQQEQLGQERQMGQEITGNLHTKENIENFSENPVPTSPNVPSEDVPDSPVTGVSMSATATRIFSLLSGKTSATVSWSKSTELSSSIDAQSRRRIPCQLLSAPVYCPPPRLSQLQFSADSIRSPLYYCPPDLKLKRTVRTERTVFPGIREKPSVNRQRLRFGAKLCPRNHRNHCPAMCTIILYNLAFLLDKK